MNLPTGLLEKKDSRKRVANYFGIKITSKLSQTHQLIGNSPARLLEKKGQ